MTRYKGRGRQNDSAWGPHPWEGARKEERFLHSGNPFNSWDISQDRKELHRLRAVWQPACGGPTERNHVTLATVTQSTA